MIALFLAAAALSQAPVDGGVALRQLQIFGEFHDPPVVEVFTSGQQAGNARASIEVLGAQNGNRTLAAVNHILDLTGACPHGRCEEESEVCNVEIYAVPVRRKGCAIGLSNQPSSDKDFVIWENGDGTRDIRTTASSFVMKGRNTQIRAIGNWESSIGVRGNATGPTPDVWTGGTRHRQPGEPLFDVTNFGVGAVLRVESGGHVTSFARDTTTGAERPAAFFSAGSAAPIGGVGVANAAELGWCRPGTLQYVRDPGGWWACTPDGWRELATQGWTLSALAAAVGASGAAAGGTWAWRRRESAGKPAQASEAKT